MNFCKGNKASSVQLNLVGGPSVRNWACSFPGQWEEQNLETCGSEERGKVHKAGMWKGQRPAGAV